MSRGVAVLWFAGGVFWFAVAIAQAIRGNPALFALDLGIAALYVGVGALNLNE